MATNIELIKRATDLAEKLGTVVVTEGLTNAALKDLIRELRAQMGDTDEDEAPVVVTRYVVAAGKAITSKRGVLADGDEVKPEFFNNGHTTISMMLKSNTIVEVEA